MKKISFLKSIAVAAMFMVAGSGAFAQYTTTPSITYAADGAAGELTDTVAIGARMPYFVAPDPAIVTLVTGGYLNQSTFKWTFTDGADGALGTTPSVLKYDGSSTSPTSGYYAENEMSVLWSTLGVFKVKVTEHSNPKVGTGCDASNTTERTVVVQNLPTVQFTSDKTVACSASSIDLPLTLAGSSPWKVSYTITRLSGTPTPKVVTDQVVSSGKNSYVASNTTLTLPVDLTGVTGGSGDYTVTINVIKDRITDKALNSLSNPVSASNVFTVKIISPTTSPIQHVKNL